MIDNSSLGFLVSIAIPTIGRASTLRRAVESALSQDYQNLEIIVSDNASEEGIEHYLEGIHDHRLILRKSKCRLGMAEHWNACLDRATGTFFLLLSDDDFLLPSAISSLVGAMHFPSALSKQYPGVAYGRARVIGENGHLMWSTAHGPAIESSRNFLSAYFTHRRSLYPCATLFRTQVLKQSSSYDGNRFGPAVDVAATISVTLATGYIASVNHIVASYTEHTQNLTKLLSTETWICGFSEIKALIDCKYSDDERFRIRLHHAIDSYIAYFIMDLAVKKSRDRDYTPWHTIIDAVQIQKKYCSKFSFAALLRIIAKYIYLYSYRL